MINTTPLPTTVTITLNLPSGTSFMRVARAIQTMANYLMPGAKIEHNGEGFVVDATLPAQKQERPIAICGNFNGVTPA